MAGQSSAGAAQAAGLACVLSCGVPVEVDLTGACEFVDATAPARDWAEGVGLVRAAGSAASDVAASLQGFYLRPPPLRPRRLFLPHRLLPH